jgi:7-cyano-7-deazaguanine reductase
MPTKKSEPRLLGRRAELPASPDAAQLDRVPNAHADTRYVARFTAPEFTTLCPVTGQPDFAHLVIDYVPRRWLVESKSLKLYLGSFRNHGAFHEDCTVAVGKRLAICSARTTCVSAATGIRAGAFLSTSSGRPAHRPRTSGCQTRAWRLIAAGAERWRRRASQSARCSTQTRGPRGGRRTTVSPD